MSGRRGAQSLADMARSLTVVGLAVAAVLLVGPARSLIFPTGQDRMAAVDYRQSVTAAARLTGAPVLAPEQLPSGWRATSARVGGGAGKPVRLHIGFAAPGETYAGVEEGTVPLAELVSEILGTAGREVRGTVSEGGRTWQLRRGDNGDRALTTSYGRLAVVVSGSASEADLRRLAASLR